MIAACAGRNWIAQGTESGLYGSPAIFSLQASMRFMNLGAQEQKKKHDYELVSISHSADFLRQWGGQMS
jgi:hypothetical protein